MCLCDNICMNAKAKIRLYLKRNSSTIVSCMGAVGVVVTTIMAIKAYMNERIGQYVIFSAVCLYFMGLMEMYPFTIMFYILIVMYYYQYTDKKNIENHH